MNSFTKLKISMDSYSNKQYSQDVKTLTQVLVFMLDHMILTLLLLASLTISSRTIMDTAKMPNM